MSLEATLLMPLVIVIIASLLFLSFYLYTLCFLNQTAYIGALRGSLSMGQGKDVESYVKTEVDQLLLTGVMNTGDVETAISVSLTGVSVRAGTTMKLPVPGLQLWNKGILEINAQKNAYYRDPVGIIRGLRRLSGAGSS